MTISSPTTTRLHYHRHDHPHTLAILESVIRGRDVPGVEATDWGLLIDWEELTEHSYLSSTERSACELAQGLAGFEWHGPPNAEVTLAISDAVAAVLS